ncbi:restriction endonuclease [Marinobacter sp. 1_MG-2023]|uniref:restriction endonuclease n=1 Tax=Marinobacter sp. 1_MG-2023 TaxID=3062627 RepID=UPI0026E17B6A|nr:restriction endonuclease [Marinobacter sp. 1_MG-2023]MDO6825426.1 restriction endonuclease [Marinobacter sp. 1_MG-2023]
MNQDTLYRLTPAEFEQLVGRLLKANGLGSVTDVGSPQDQGVNFTGEQEGETVAVLVKHRKTPLTVSEIRNIVGRLKSSRCTPSRLIIVTSAKVTDAVASSLANGESDLPVQIIDRDAVLHMLSADPSLQKGPVTNAEKRARRQRRELWYGTLGAIASILGVIASGVSLFVEPTPQPLQQRIETVESAIDNLKNLENELVDIKEEMAQTEKATRAIEQEYEKAKQLQQLTEEQFSAVKSALEKKSWYKTLLDYFLGFVLGVAGSLTASVIYSRAKQKRALADVDA